MATFRWNSTVIAWGWGPSELALLYKSRHSHIMCQRGKKDALPEGIRVLVCETLGPKAKFVGRDRPLAQVTDVGPLQTRWHLTCVNVVLRARKRVWLGYRHTWVHDGRTVPRGSEHGAVSASDREPSACDDGSTGHGDASGKCSTCACHSTSKRSSTDAMAGRGLRCERY